MSQNKLYPSSCKTCNGWGVKKITNSTVCDCSQNKLLYSVCCYCQNLKQYGNYVECDKCLGTGKKTK